MVGKRYRTPSPVETPRHAKVTRLTRSGTSSAKKNSILNRCVCNQSSPSSSPCQFCDPINSHSIVNNDDETADSDDGTQQPATSPLSKLDVHTPRVCANNHCDNSLPQKYSYRNCQPCITAYRERYRDGNLACKGRCGTRIPRSSRSDFCPSCRKSASPTKKNSNRKSRASAITRCRGCGNELPPSHQYKSCDPCRQRDRDYKRASLALKARREANKGSDEVVEEENQVEVADQDEVHAAREVIDNSTKEPGVEELMNELQAQRNQLLIIAQEDIAEYAHLNILNRLLRETKEEFIQNKISPEIIVETFENLASQIEEAANRRLRHIPVGFGMIMDIIGTGNAGNNREGEAVASVHHNSQARDGQGSTSTGIGKK